MGETRTTAPVFPPGRYGRRRDGRRHLAVPATILVLVLALGVLIAVRLYRQYGDPDYNAQIVGWTGVTATQMTVQFTVQVPPGGAATCQLTALAYDGTEVGARTVTVRATGDARSISASEPITTTARASAGKVVSCRPTG